MGYFTDLINNKSVKKIVIPQYAKPNLNTDLKISAPTGKSLTLEQLPPLEREKARAEIRQAELKATGKPEEKFLFSNFAKVIAQAFPRAVMSFTLEAVKGGEMPFTPQTNFEKFLYGEEPVKSVSQKAIEAEPLASSIVGKKAGLPVSTVIAFGLTALDLTPFGGTKKGLTKEIIEATTDDIAKALLKKAGVADDLAEAYAKQVVKAKTVKEAEAIITRLDELAKTTTKTTPAVVSKAGDVFTTAPETKLGGAVALKVVKPVIQATPENTLQKLIKAIDDAVPLRGEQQKLYQQEMAKRTARVASMGSKVGGEAGFYAQLGQLKGELPKKVFESIKKQFNQTEIDTLFNTIESTKTLLPLEKVSAKGGLQKLFTGVVPTNGEIQLLKETFPKELIDAILARRPLLEKLGKIGEEILNIPRTVMASVDLSAPLRQGVFMVGRPKQFLSSFKDMFKYAFSEKAYQGLMASIKARPTYLKMKQAGLSLTEIGGELTKREEAFMGNIIEKIPGLGKLVRGSNRAYTGFLNKLRADVFDDILKKAGIAGNKVDNKGLESLADFINSATGRGKFGLKETGIIPKGAEKIAPVLNAVFFSPRLMASRLNLLNPYFYAQLQPLARKEALKTLFATSGIFGSLYGLWKLGGGDVGVDPRSADFGKLKVGNTRYDVLGGFQQYIKLASQLITGELVSSTTGRTITLGEGYKPLTRKDIALRFFESKTSPIASFIIGLATGQTATGEDVDVPTEIINRFIPMVVGDLYDLSQEKGAEGLLMGLPAIFGVGSQTYGKQEYVEGKNPLGEQTSQIRPTQGVGEKLRELVLGQLPLGTSKTYSVEAYFDQLSNLPRDEAKQIFDKIAEGNPELAKKLLDVVKDKEKGITVKDKDLKSKGVASGERALAIKKEFDKLKTKEEKAKLWEDYVKKGIITKDVAKQLTKLLD